jgi:hypothetical protein
MTGFEPDQDWVKEGDSLKHQCRFPGQRGNLTLLLFSMIVGRIDLLSYITEIYGAPWTLDNTMSPHFWCYSSPTRQLVLREYGWWHWALYQTRGLQKWPCRTEIDHANTFRLASGCKMFTFGEHGCAVLLLHADAAICLHVSYLRALHVHVLGSLTNNPCILSTKRIYLMSFCKAVVTKSQDVTS